MIFYELLTGVPPFHAEDDFDLIDMHVHHEPPSLAEIGLPGPVDEVFFRAMAKEPAQRFASAQEMAAALEIAAQSLAR